MNLLAVDTAGKTAAVAVLRDDTLLAPAERNVHSHQEAVRQLKDFIRQRGRWMDENIESLRQYSAESRVKKYSEVTD